MRQALGRLLGCNDPDTHGLTRDQRTDCFAKARPAAPLHIDPSPEELAAFNADKREPLLVRKPHNGCEPRVADRPSPLGSAAGTTTAGIGCAWSF